MGKMTNANNRNGMIDAFEPSPKGAELRAHFIAGGSFVAVLVHFDKSPPALSQKTSRVMTPVNWGTLKRCMNASHLHKNR